jgi:hypothetical protein
MLRSFCTSTSLGSGSHWAAATPATPQTMSSSPPAAGTCCASSPERWTRRDFWPWRKTGDGSFPRGIRTARRNPGRGARTVAGHRVRGRRIRVVCPTRDRTPGRGPDLRVRGPDRRRAGSRGPCRHRGRATDAARREPTPGAACCPADACALPLGPPGRSARCVPAHSPDADRGARPRARRGTARHAGSDPSPGSRAEGPGPAGIASSVSGTAADCERHRARRPRSGRRANGAGNSRSQRGSSGPAELRGRDRSACRPGGRGRRRGLSPGGVELRGRRPVGRESRRPVRLAYRPAQTASREDDSNRRVPRRASRGAKRSLGGEPERLAATDRFGLRRGAHASGGFAWLPDGRRPAESRGRRRRCDLGCEQDHRRANRLRHRARPGHDGGGPQPGGDRCRRRLDLGDRFDPELGNADRSGHEHVGHDPPSVTARPRSPSVPEACG